MTRSIKKGPYIEPALLRKLQRQQGGGKKEPVKTWSRRSTITPDFVGITISVHDGRKHVPIFITENMVGYKLGDFASTRTFKRHGGVKAKVVAQKT